MPNHEAVFDVVFVQVAQGALGLVHALAVREKNVIEIDTSVCESPNNRDELDLAPFAGVAIILMNCETECALTCGI